MIKRKIGFACAMALGVFAANGADYATTLGGYGPVGYWRLNEQSQPPVPTYTMGNVGSGGAALNGLYYGVPTLGVPGALTSDTDKAAEFGSTSRFGEVPYSAALNPPASFTVEFWAKRTNSSTATASVLCNFGPSRSNGYLVFSGNADLKWTFRTYNGTTRGSLISTAAIVQDQWTHVVCVHESAGDGTNFIYIDGVLDSFLTPAPYAPQTVSNLRLGIGPNNEAPAWYFPGQLDDIAIYPTALSSTAVAAHYQAATTPAPATPYATLVQTDGAVAYWRLNEATLPPYVAYPAVNSGSLGTAVNGTYSTLGSTSGVAGPVRSQYAGFAADNRAVGLNGANGQISIPPFAVSTDTATFTGWVKRNGSVVNASPIIGQRASASPMTGLVVDFSNRLGYVWNDDAATYNYNPGADFFIPEGVWTFAAVTITPTNATMYIGGTNGLKSATRTGTHLAHDFNGGNLYIGWDSGSGTRYLNGSLDEVAVFDKALTSLEVSNLFYSATPAIPLVVRTPADPLYEGSTITFTAYGVGSSTVSYQWRKNGGNLSGKTASTLVLNNAVVADSGSFDVVVTGAGVSVTSAPSAITVVAGPPIVVQQPTSTTRYEGAKVTFTAGIQGSVPWSFQWKKAGTAIPGATDSSYTIPAVVAGDAGSYSVTVSNPLGTTDSSAATLTVLPTTGYATTVMRDGAPPVAYYRLNEKTGTTAYDYAGGQNAEITIYAPAGDITNNAAGPVPSSVPAGFPGLESTNTAYWFGGNDSIVKTPGTIGLNTNTVTITAMVNWEGSMKGDLMWLVNLGGGKGFHVNNDGVLRYHWDGNWDWSSGLPLPVNQWAFVALVVEPSKATIYIDDGNGGGLQSAVHTGSHPNTGFATFGIGSDPNNWGWRPFRGMIDEVAVYNRALTPGEIANAHLVIYSGSPTVPVIVSQPKSQTVIEGTPVSFSVSAYGALPLSSMSYQWKHAGTNLPGATQATLTIPSAYYTDTGTYQVTVANSQGTVNSSVASLVVESPSSFAYLTNDLVVHLRFDGNLTDSSGRTNDATAMGTPVFVAGKIGSQAVQVNTEKDVAYNWLQLWDANLNVPYADLSFTEVDSFSVAFWVKYSVVAGDLPIIGNVINSTYNKGWVFAENFSSKLVWTAHGDVGAVDADGIGPVIKDGTWHHVVTSFDRTAAVARTFIDGLEVDARSIEGLGNLDTGYPVCIGQDPTGVYSYSGTYAIDDIGIWRRALTPSQATGIYAAGQVGQSFDVKGPGALTMKKSGANLELIWQSGTLQSVDNLGDAWVNVPGAVAPYHVVAPAAGKKFYRVKF